MLTDLVEDKDKVRLKETVGYTYQIRKTCVVTYFIEKFQA